MKRLNPGAFPVKAAGCDSQNSDVIWRDVVEVGTFGQLSKVDAGFGNGHTVDHGGSGFSQGFDIARRNPM